MARNVKRIRREEELGVPKGNEDKKDSEKKGMNIPNNDDNTLIPIYGDYMQLPPVEEQVSHHKFKAYYLDR